MKRDVVSVIIPVFNIEPFIARCLESILCQTYQNIEIICVNDGSTDNSLSLLNMYKKRDQRIIIIDKEHDGLACARNIGIDASNGKYIYFLDGDDYIKENLIEHAVENMNTYNVDYVCFGSVSHVEQNMQESTLADWKCKIKYDGKVETNFTINKNTNIHVWNKLFKSSIIKDYNIKFIDGVIFEDIFFVWTYFFLSKSAYYDKAEYHHYRIRENSIMDRMHNNPSRKAFDHLHNWYRLFLFCKNNQHIYLERYANLDELFWYYYFITKKFLPCHDMTMLDIMKNEYLAMLYSENRKYGLMHHQTGIKATLIQVYAYLCMSKMKRNHYIHKYAPKYNLIMTLLVKNEEDIIEKNILFHKNMGVDAFIVTDNNSTDNTRAILEKYKNKGWILEIIDEPEKTYLQQAWVHRMIMLAKHKYGATWVINADADEFWYADTLDLKNEIRMQKDCNVLMLPLVNYYPMEQEGHCTEGTLFIKNPMADFENVDNTIQASHFLRSKKHGGHFKCIHKTRGYRMIGYGNHSVDIRKKRLAYITRITLYHYFIRNYHHFENKVITHYEAIKLNPIQYVGQHIRRYYEEFYLKGTLKDLYNDTLERKNYEFLKNQGCIVTDRSVSNFMKMIEESYAIMKI